MMFQKCLKRAHPVWWSGHAPGWRDLTTFPERGGYLAPGLHAPGHSAEPLPRAQAPLACVAAHSSHCGRMNMREPLGEDGHLRANGASLCKYGSAAPVPSFQAVLGPRWLGWGQGSRCPPSHQEPTATRGHWLGFWFFIIEFPSFFKLPLLRTVEIGRAHV